MFFDEAARQWDTPRRIERAKVLSGQVAAALQNRSGLTALEIGCGTGLLTLELSSFFYEIDGIEPSEEMAETLRRKGMQAGVSNIKLYQEKKLMEPEWDNRFDIIYSSMAFHHIPDTAAELSLLFPLLKKGGQFLLIDLDKVDPLFHFGEPGFHGHNGFDRRKLERELLDCGFQEVSFQESYRGEKKVERKAIPYTLFFCKAVK